MSECVCERERDLFRHSLELLLEVLHHFEEVLQLIGYLHTHTYTHTHIYTHTYTESKGRESKRKREREKEEEMLENCVEREREREHFIFILSDSISPRATYVHTMGILMCERGGVGR